MLSHLIFKKSIFCVSLSYNDICKIILTILVISASFANREVIKRGKDVHDEKSSTYFNFIIIIKKWGPNMDKGPDRQ